MKSSNLMQLVLWLALRDGIPAAKALIEIEKKKGN